MTEVAKGMQKTVPPKMTPVFNSVSPRANPNPDHENFPKVPPVVKELLLRLRWTLKTNITFNSEKKPVLEAPKKMKKIKIGRAVNPVSNSTLPAVISVPEGVKNLKVSSVRKDILLPGHSATEKNGTFDRLSTAVALIVCIATASVFVKWAWDKFSNSPIVVNVETTNYPLYRLHFPAVTICPANIIKKTIGEEILARYLNVSLSSRVQHDLWNVMSALAKCQYPFYYRMKDHLAESSHILPQFAGFNVSHFMLQVLPTCSEFLGSCFWLGNEVNCCEIFHLQRTEVGFCYSFNSLTSEETWSCAESEEFSRIPKPNRRRNESKKCEPRRNIASGTTTGLEVFLRCSRSEDSLQEGQRDKSGARVYLHHPRQFPEFGTGVLMPEDPHKVFRVEVTPSVTESSPNVRALSISQRHCLFPDELRLSVFNTYTQQNCLLECRLKNIASYCGCYPYFFSAFTVADIPECNLTQLWCLSEHNLELRIFRPPMGTLGFENLTAIDCSKCLPTCHDSRYALHYSYADDANSYAKNCGGYLDVFYKDLSAIKYRQEMAFDFMDLVVSFGGVVSLFLGVSLLSVFQFLCRCAMRCVFFYHGMRQGLTNTPRPAWVE